MNAYQKAVFGTYDAVFGMRIRESLSKLEEMQYWPRERLLEDQNRKIRDLVRHAYDSVPHYRALLKSRGLTPADIQCRDDLTKIPPLTKEDIRKGTADRTLFSGDTRGPVFARMSSGSTGKHTTVFVGKEAASANWAAMLLGWQWAGYVFGRRIFQFGITAERGPVKRIKDIATRCQYTPAFGLDDDRLAGCVDRIVRKKISQIMGYASAMYLLARYCERQNIFLRHVRTVVTWGDTLFPNYRKCIEERFGARVTDSYGTGEDLMSSSQCDAHRDYHVFMPFVHVEYVRDGRLARPGEIGEILITRLVPGPMPLIRYAVGDAGAPGGGTCPCGRGFELMSALHGRNTDIVAMPSGRFMTVHDFTGIFAHFPSVAQFLVRQNAAFGLEIQVVPGDGFRDTDLEEIEGSIRRICGREDVQIRFERVRDIPPARSGKRRFVISEVGVHAGG